MIAFRKIAFAGISLLASTAVNAQFQIHDGWSTQSKYAVHNYNFSVTQDPFPLMSVFPVGDVRWAGYQLTQSTNKCFFVRTSGFGSRAMDTKIWSENGSVVYNDDRVDGNRHAGFMWWNTSGTINFRIAAFSPAYNDGAFRLDINEISGATSETACNNYNTNYSFVKGTTLITYRP